MELYESLRKWDKFQDVSKITFESDTILTEIEKIDLIIVGLLRGFVKNVLSKVKTNCVNGIGDMNKLLLTENLSEKLVLEKKSLLKAQDEIAGLKNQNKIMKEKLKETIQDMDLLRHKIYMMHDRYEEKMDELEMKEKTMENEIKRLVDESKMQTIDITNSSYKNEDYNLMQLELKTKIEQIESSTLKITDIETQLRNSNIELENLKISYKLFTEIPIKIKPEFKSLSTLNDILSQENKDLKEYLKIFWNIISQFKTTFKSDIYELNDYLISYINKLVLNITEIENEKQDLKIKYQDQLLVYNRDITNLKQTNETIEQLNDIITTLKTQNEFYSNQLKEIRENGLKIDNDVEFETIEDAIKKIKEQDVLLNQLKSQQDTIIQEMEITATSYEETFEKNSQLLIKLKEKQDLNLNISSDLFKSNQTIQQLTNKITKLTKINEHDILKNDKYEKFDKYTNDLELIGNKFQNNIDLYFNNLNENSIKIDLEQKIVNIQSQFEINQLQLEKLKLDNANLIVQINDLKQDKIVLDNKIKQIESNQNNNIQGDDMILNEQLKIYKSKLTCPCCNGNKIDAILIKCFHLFCFSCLEVRYETRQRKCPKCNTSFGNHDFHRIFF